MTHPVVHPRLSLSGFLFEDDYRRQSLSLDEYCVRRSWPAGAVA